MLWAHLFALAIAYFRVGCRVEPHLHCIFGAPLCLTAFMSSAGNPDQVRFDSDSFPVRVNNHASYCMANSPHLFENLALSEVGKVDDINDGSEIAGKGTFKFKLTDDDGRTHIIRDPNSLYLPKLRVASYHHNIGHRRRETGKHGWSMALITASCSGPMDGRRCLSTSPATHQFSTLLHCILLLCVSGICWHVRGHGGIILSEGDSNPNPWSPPSEGGC
jgi:hypothetical protein